MRNLVIILGDQLDRRSAAFDNFDAREDRVWMAEVTGEAAHVWSAKARIAMFLAAMRHFRQALEDEGLPLDYVELAEGPAYGSLGEALRAAVNKHAPANLVCVQPGEWRVLEMLKTEAKSLGIGIEFREDRHFFSTPADFAEHARNRKTLRLEFFYREMRQRYGVLVDDAGKPIGGKWNYDIENRGSFGKDGPGLMPVPHSFGADNLTREVIALVNKRFAQHPGTLQDFDWPLTPAQATTALSDFIKNRLPDFGRYQDAMWTDQPWLYHSRLSAAMNLKLLDPRDVVDAAVQAYRNNRAPLEAAEGFIRQVLGWREYVRGIYWNYMPQYLERNALGAEGNLPAFYWSGETEMECMRQAIGQTLRFGYAHHIQRLMVTGLYAMLHGVNPRFVHEWYLAVYVDAVEWVELPNTLGMSQYGDGGLMASKPYAASGKYIQRMSNYCAQCRYNPAEATGENACPFTTLYWDFLMRHEKRLSQNPRMKMQVRNLARLDNQRRAEIRSKADDWRAKQSQRR